MSITIINNNYWTIEKRFANRKLWFREYYYQGKLHRLDGPAREIFDGKGNVTKYEYFIDNNRHRLDGPAVERFDASGKSIEAIYYLNGKYLLKTEHKRQVALIKLATQTYDAGGVSL